MLKRTLLTAVCSAALFVLSTSSASAADNHKISFSFSFVDHFDCADPVQISSAGDEMVHKFYDADGNLIRLSFTGNVIIEFTDLTTGTTYRPNSSGPGTTDITTGWTTVRGHNGAILAGDIGIFTTAGRVLIDPDGVPVDMPNHVISVCEALGTTTNTL